MAWLCSVLHRVWKPFTLIPWAPGIPIAVTSARWRPRAAFVKRPGLVDVSIGPATANEGRQADEPMAAVDARIEAAMRRLCPEACR